MNDASKDKTESGASASLPCASIYLGQFKLEDNKSAIPLNAETGSSTWYTFGVPSVSNSSDHTPLFSTTLHTRIVYFELGDATPYLPVKNELGRSCQ